VRKTIWVLISLILVSLLTGCAELFEFNLFQALDPIKMPDAAMLSEMEDEDGVSGVLDYLDAELGSPGFIEKLDEEPGSYDAIEDYLTGIFTVGTLPANEEEQRAAILYADLNLKTTGGEELVNNSVSALLGGDFSGDSLNTPAEVRMFLLGFLPEVMPASALNSQSAFDEMLQGFVAANAAYDDFGNSSLIDIPDEINMGDVAQKALVSYVIAEAIGVYSNVQLYQIAQGVDPGEDPTGSILDPFTAGSPVDNILNAAGFDTSNFQ
jgi:hypothetical protein